MVNHAFLGQKSDEVRQGRGNRRNGDLEDQAEGLGVEHHNRGEHRVSHVFRVRLFLAGVKPNYDVSRGWIAGPPGVVDLLIHLWGAGCSEYDVRGPGTEGATLPTMQTETWTDETLCEASYVAFVDAIEAEANAYPIVVETSVDDATLALWSL